MKKEKIFNVPNALSFYRIAIFPVILGFVFAGNEFYFSVFLCINLVTDILDGLIARAFKLQTNFGARLDSLADIGTYILAFCGVLKFKWDDINSSSSLLWVLIAVYLFAHLISLARFGKFPSLHLYSCKIGGYIQGIFFFVLFFSGYHEWLFRLAAFWGILSYVEEAVILFLSPEMRSNCKGLYWILRK